MTQEEQIRLYRLMEKLNWFFHQEMHYLNRDIAEKTARVSAPVIKCKKTPRKKCSFVAEVRKKR